MPPSIPTPNLVTFVEKDVPENNNLWPSWIPCPEMPSPHAFSPLTYPSFVGSILGKITTSVGSPHQFKEWTVKTVLKSHTCQKNYLICSFVIFVVYHHQNLMDGCEIHSWTSIAHGRKGVQWGWRSFLILRNSEHHMRCNLKADVGNTFNLQ